MAVTRTSLLSVGVRAGAAPAEALAMNYAGVVGAGLGGAELFTQPYYSAAAALITPETTLYRRLSSLSCFALGFLFHDALAVAASRSRYDLARKTSKGTLLKQISS